MIGCPLGHQQLRSGPVLPARSPAARQPALRSAWLEHRRPSSHGLQEACPCRHTALLHPGASSAVSSQPMTRGPVLPHRQPARRQDVRRHADTGQIEGSANRRPPNILVRVISAGFFMIPWMDIFGLSAIYDTFPQSLILLKIGKPFVAFYFQSQWTPLILFFLMYLYVIRNTKLHHFLRCNAMTAIMVDIVTMLVTLVRQYFPAEIRWSLLQDVFDIFSFSMIMFTILWCQFFALRGRYADIPFVTDAVCMQVEPSV